jgi:hypothetical protein
MPTCSFCDQNYSKKDHAAAHGIIHDCDLKPHSAQELYNAATAAHNLRIRNYVKEFYAKILETVGQGRFSVSFEFECDPEDDRQQLLTTVIDRLQAKFKDILCTKDSTGHEFEVSWAQPSFTNVQMDNTSSTCQMREAMRSASKKQIPKEIKSLLWEKYIGSATEH